MWVGGCQGGISTFPFGCRFLPSSFVAASVGRGASYSAVELFEGGVSNAEIARAVGVCDESVRRCRRVWEQDGASGLRRRAATGRPPKLDDTQVEMVRAALEQGAQAHGFEADLWTLERVGAVVTRATGVVLSRASVWRLLTGRLRMEPATARAAGGRAGRVGDRPLDRARVAAHQEGAVNTHACIVFLDESGVSLLPQIRRAYWPRWRTPLLRHRLNWKRASMAGALGYHSTDPDRGARLCFHLKPGSYTARLIEVLEQVKVFHRGERVVLVWDGLSAHWSRAMRAWVAGQDWLSLERLPAYAPELNPVELLWPWLKKCELANLDANPRLPWSFLAHTSLTIRPPHPPNLRKDQ